jgi:hypothetical protein
VKNDIKAFLAGAIFLTLLFSVVAIDLRPLSAGGPPRLQTFAPWEGDATAPENARGVAEFMFGPYALPLQILSAALLVALVGAIALAKPALAGEDEPPAVALPVPEPAPPTAPPREPPMAAPPGGQR